MTWGLQSSQHKLLKSDHTHHISHKKARAHAHSRLAARSISASFEHHACLCTHDAPNQDLSPSSILNIKLYVQVMDLSGGPRRSFAPGLGRVVVSTLCVQDNLIAAGGFNGDLVIRNTSQQEPVCRYAVHATVHAFGLYLTALWFNQAR